jgi:hypothetical protein
MFSASAGPASAPAKTSPASVAPILLLTVRSLIVALPSTIMALFHRQRQAARMPVGRRSWLHPSPPVPLTVTIKGDLKTHGRWEDSAWWERSRANLPVPDGKSGIFATLAGSADCSRERVLVAAAHVRADGLVSPSYSLRIG